MKVPATVLALALAAAPAAAGVGVEEAVRGSLAYLADEGERWSRGELPVQEGKACVSCHHVGYAVWTRAEAERAGIVEPSADADDFRRRALALNDRDGEARVVSSTQFIMARADTATDLDLMRGDGKPDGSWRARGQFPTQIHGEQEGDDVASLWAIAALVTLEVPDPPTAARVERALEWLARAEPGVSTEWTVARLVVAHRRGEERLATSLVDRLLAAQRDDGGWSWLDGAPSNPLTTGQAVFALATADDPRARQAVASGADYLLRTRQADGTWLTPSRLASVEPSADKDGIYRYWGTAWATLGLTRALASGLLES